MAEIHDLEMLTVNLLELHVLGFIVCLTVAVLSTGEVYDIQITDVREEGAE